MRILPVVCAHKRKRVIEHGLLWGDMLNYHADLNAPVVGILDIKIHLNSTISDTKKGHNIVLRISRIIISTMISPFSNT